MKKLMRIAAVMLAAFMLVMLAAVSAAALDDTYRFDEFGMSVRVPKTYMVITRESARGDKVFSDVGLDYDETLTAFKAADIYLRAYDPDGVFQISLTVSSDEHSKAVNNYSDLSDSERKAVLEVFLAEPTVTSAVELKHGGSIFFDISRETALSDEPLFISQCNTVINGYQINITLQKAGEAVIGDETRALNAIASSLSFDKIRLLDSGPAFDWWRIALWIVILILLTVGISYVYKRYNTATRRRLEERRQRRAERFAEEGEDGEEGSLSFEEALGYVTDDQFESRAGADLDSFEISVAEKDPNSGVSYFEDEGESIDDKVDYFDTYFKEKTESRSGMSRMFASIGAYFGIAFRHIGYFFKNLFKGKNSEGRR